MQTSSFAMISPCSANIVQFGKRIENLNLKLPLTVLISDPSKSFTNLTAYFRPKLVVCFGNSKFNDFKRITEQK